MSSLINHTYFLVKKIIHLVVIFYLNFTFGYHLVRFTSDNRKTNKICFGRTGSTDCRTNMVPFSIINFFFNMAL